MTSLRTLAAALLLTLTATVAAAQFLQPAPEPEAAPEAQAGADQGGEPTATPTDPTRALLDVLRDDAARAALIAELERLTAPGDAAAPGDESAAAGQEGAPAEGAAPAPPDRSIGRQLRELSQAGIASAQASADAFLNGLSATQRRLAGLVGPRSQALLDAGRALALLVVATILTHEILFRVARRLFRGMAGRAADADTVGRVLMWIGKFVVDVAVVLLAWALGYVMSLAALRNGADTGVLQTLYLNAFLAANLFRAALRSLMAPETPALRLAPLSDSAARYWNGRIAGIVGVLVYGLLLLVPVVNQTVSVFTGRAVAVVVYAVALIWSMALVIRHRRAPHDWLAARARAADGDATLRTLAAVASVWHWPALAYLLFLFVSAVSEAATVGPILVTTAQALGVLAGGALLGGLLARTAREGVHVPADLALGAPMLEERLNGFLRRFLGVARFVLALATIGVAIDVSGVYDMGGWFVRRFGEDFGSAVFSVTVIVVIAFAIWLAIASYVDYRLNPEKGTADARERTLMTLLRNAATVAIVIFTLMFGLSEIGLDIAPLLASAGVLGLAIGFGAQRLVQDIITGIFIQFENAINVGDVITVGGVSGAVEKLTIRSVSLRSLDGTFHIIPFSSVDMVSNFMKDFSFHVAEIGIAYREDVGEAKRLMHDAFDELKADPVYASQILGAFEWHGLTAFGDSAIMVRGRIRTRPGAQWAAGRAYNEIVKRMFDEAGVEIPFPHMTVWFGEDKAGMAPPARVAAKVEQPKVVNARPVEPPSRPPEGQDGPNSDLDGDGVTGDDPR